MIAASLMLMTIFQLGFIIHPQKRNFFLCFLFWLLVQHFHIDIRFFYNNHFGFFFKLFFGKNYWKIKYFFFFLIALICFLIMINISIELLFFFVGGGFIDKLKYEQIHFPMRLFHFSLLRKLNNKLVRSTKRQNLIFSVNDWKNEHIVSRWKKILF